MRCAVHNEREPVSVCSHCGKGICAECAVDVEGKSMCKQCIALLAGGRRHDARYSYGERSYYHGPKTKTHNKVFLFILSALPGLGYMYLGLIKRGLFVMSAFFLNIYLLVEFELPILAFLIPIIFFAAFFDGFKILRQINDGIAVPDSIEDFKNFARKNKLLVCGGFSAIVGIGILNNILNLVGRYAYHGLFGYNLFEILRYGLLLFVMFAVGAVLFKRGRRFRVHGHRRCGHTHHHGHREEYNNPNDTVDKR